MLRAGANNDHVDSEGCTALIRAAQKQRNAVVDTLISAGADVNATVNANSRRFRVKTTALSFAVDSDNEDIAEVLIRAGADVNADPVSGYLGRALNMKHYGMAEALLAAGADMEQRSIGKTALHWASSLFSSDEHAVTLLLAAGANPNSISDDGRTALHMVAHIFSSEGDEIARMLIHAGARTDILDINGKTAVDLAKKRGRTNMLKMLMSSNNGRSL